MCIILWQLLQCPFTMINLKVHLSVVLLCNKLPPNLAALTQHLLSHSFYRSGIQVWLSWCLCLKVLWSYSQGVMRSHISLEDSVEVESNSKLLTGFSYLWAVELRRTSVPCQLLARERPLSVPCHVGLFIEGSSQHGSWPCQRENWDDMHCICCILHIC